MAQECHVTSGGPWAEFLWRQMGLGGAKIELQIGFSGQAG